MSITAYVGLPGAGKSYGIIQHVIIPALDSGRVVWTNIPIKPNLLRDHPGVLHEWTWEEAKVDLTAFLDTVPPGAVLVLDEAWNAWAGGDKAKDIPVAQREFFAMHRHKAGSDGRTTEIVICCQDLGQVSAFLRQLIEQTFVIVKLSALGLRKRYRVDVYSGAVTGQAPPVTKRIAQYAGVYKPEVYQYYYSHTQSSMTGIEQVVDDRGVVWKSPAFKIGAVICVVLFMVGAWRVNTFFHPSVQVPEQVAVARPLNVPVSVLPPLPIVTQESKHVDPTTWRIVGDYSMANRLAFALLRDTRGLYRRVLLNTCMKTPELECIVDGQVVTRYTGTDPNDNGSFLGKLWSAGSSPAPASVASALRASIVQ